MQSRLQVYYSLLHHNDAISDIIINNNIRVDSDKNKYRFFVWVKKDTEVSYFSFIMYNVTTLKIFKNAIWSTLS